MQAAAVVKKLEEEEEEEEEEEKKKKKKKKPAPTEKTYSLLHLSLIPLTYLTHSLTQSLHSLLSLTWCCARRLWSWRSQI